MFFFFFFDRGLSYFFGGDKFHVFFWFFSVWWGVLCVGEPLRGLGVYPLVL